MIVRRFLSTLAPVGLALVSCVRSPGDKAQAPVREGPSLAGCVPAEGSRIAAPEL